MCVCGQVKGQLQYGAVHSSAQHAAWLAPAGKLSANVLLKQQFLLDKCCGNVVRSGGTCSSSCTVVKLRGKRGKWISQGGSIRSIGSDELGHLAAAATSAPWVVCWRAVGIRRKRSGSNARTALTMLFVQAPHAI